MSSIAPQSFYRQKSSMDIEDIALLFIEEEVGRFDWQNNWQTLKAKGGLQERLQRWLSALNIEASPDEVVAYLDRLVTERTGRWR